MVSARGLEEEVEAVEEVAVAAVADAPGLPDVAGESGEGLLEGDGSAWRGGGEVDETGAVVAADAVEAVRGDVGYGLVEVVVGAVSGGVMEEPDGEGDGEVLGAVHGAVSGAGAPRLAACRVMGFRQAGRLSMLGAWCRQARSLGVAEVIEGVSALLEDVLAVDLDAVEVSGAEERLGEERDP